MSLVDGVESHDDGKASNQAFKKVFRVAVQNKYLRTPEIIKVMGTPTTGNKQLDRRLQENFVEIMATPIACVEYYLMGATIKFANAAIPYQILRILRQHLKNWDYIISTMYNVQPPPLEDIDDITEFCECIIKYAGAHGRGRDGTSSLLLMGRVNKAATAMGYTLPEIGSRRRRLAPIESTEPTKSGTDIRAEKMMNFRKSFTKLKAGES